MSSRPSAARTILINLRTRKGPAAAMALGRFTGLTGKDEVVWLRACLAACTTLAEPPADY
jgi:hypothetical protein